MEFIWKIRLRHAPFTGNSHYNDSLGDNNAPVYAYDLFGRLNGIEETAAHANNQHNYVDTLDKLHFALQLLIQLLWIDGQGKSYKSSPAISEGMPDKLEPKEFKKMVHNLCLRSASSEDEESQSSYNKVFSNRSDPCLKLSNLLVHEVIFYHNSHRAV